MTFFKDKHIWIIGASTGIGYELTKALDKEGASLALSARSQDKLNELNAELHNKHSVHPVDVSDVEAMQKTAQSIADHFKKLDSVIFLAALYDPVTLDKLDIEATHKMVDVNLNGAFHTVHATLPIFTAQGYGQIALCGSVAGYRGLPAGQPYSATKAAVINLAESLKAEQPELDVKVINPGFVRTPLTDKNNFDMPMMIEPDEAAASLIKGLKSKLSLKL